MKRREMSASRFNELIDEVTCESCGHQYCFLKTFVQSLHPSADIIVQLKCLEKFKWEESEKAGHEVDWNETAFIWANSGYAAAFREVFDEDLSVKEIYKRTLNMIRNKEIETKPLTS